MNIHDIELPPLPKPAMNEGDTALYAAFAGSQLTDYARAAIEPYKQRIEELEAQLEAFDHAETRMNRAGSSDSEIELPALPEAEIDDAGAFMSDAQVMTIESAKEYARVAVEHDRQQRSFTKPSTNQDWLSLDPAVAFHLIERHAENWNDAGAMMQAYADAHIEADRQRKGEVVVTKDEAGYIVAVTRQDKEGRILSVIAEADRQRRGEPVDTDLVQRWQREHGVVLTPGSREAAMVVIRHDEDGKPTVWCDPEIADLVRALNDGGVATLASCSGHGWRPGNIMLSDGRVLVVCKDADEAREVASHFPGINGEAPQPVDPVELDRYDAGLLGGQDGMPAYVWHDIIRAELDRAYDFYMDQLDRAAPQPAEPVKVPSDAQSKADRFRNEVARILGLGSEGGRFVDTYLLGLISDLVELADEFHVRDERRIAMRETTYYLLYEHKEGFSSHPKKSDLRKHIKELDAENDRLHALLARYGSKS